MSFSRVPQPTRHTDDGLLFPATIEIASPAMVTDCLTAAVAGKKVRIDARNVDPMTRALSACLFEMSPKDARHFLGTLTKVVEACEAAGG